MSNKYPSSKHGSAQRHAKSSLVPRLTLIACALLSARAVYAQTGNITPTSFPNQENMTYEVSQTIDGSPLEIWRYTLENGKPWSMVAPTEELSVENNIQFVMALGNASSDVYPTSSVITTENASIDFKKALQVGIQPETEGISLIGDIIGINVDSTSGVNRLLTVEGPTKIELAPLQSESVYTGDNSGNVSMASIGLKVFQTLGTSTNKAKFKDNVSVSVALRPNIKQTNEAVQTHAYGLYTNGNVSTHFDQDLSIEVTTPTSYTLTNTSDMLFGIAASARSFSNTDKDKAEEAALIDQGIILENMLKAKGATSITLTADNIPNGRIQTYGIYASGSNSLVSLLSMEFNQLGIKIVNSADIATGIKQYSSSNFSVSELNIDVSVKDKQNPNAKSTGISTNGIFDQNNSNSINHIASSGYETFGVNADGAYVNFDGSLELDVTSYYRGIGLYLSEGSRGFFNNTVTINSESQTASAYGLYAINESSGNFANGLSVDVSNSATGYGTMLWHSATGTFNGPTQIFSDNTGKAFGIYALDNSTGVFNGSTSVAISNSDTAYGVYLRTQSNATFDGETNISLINTNLTAVGIYVEANLKDNIGNTEFKGATSVSILSPNGSSKQAYGLFAVSNSKAKFSDIGIQMDNIENGSGIYLAASSSVDVSGSATIDLLNSARSVQAIDVKSGSTVSIGKTLSISGNLFTNDDHLTLPAITVKASDGSNIFASSAIINPYSWSEYQGLYTEDTSATPTVQAIALQSLKNSKIELGSKDGNVHIAGAILAGLGSTETSNTDNGSDTSTVKITGDTVQIVGDVFSAHGSTIDIALKGANSYLEGQIDDFHELNVLSNNEVHHHSAFLDSEGQGVYVSSAGQVNLTLDGGTWFARGQNFIDSLKFDSNKGLVDLSLNNNSSVSAANLSGSGTFRMKLGSTANASDSISSDMIYVQQVQSGSKFTIDAVLDGSVKSITDLANLRFATIKDVADGHSDDLFSIEVKDQGFNDWSLAVAREEYFVSDPENTLYNGADNGEGSFKPGTNYVDAVFSNKTREEGDSLASQEDQSSAQNYFIVPFLDSNTSGDSHVSHISDAGKAVIASARAVYFNSIEIDRFNQRYGDRLYDSNNRLWARVRHDRIGTASGLGDFKSQNTTYQFGLDYAFPVADAKLTLGGAFDLMDGNTDFESIDGSGEVRRYSLSLYGTYMSETGTYVDVVAKAGRLSNEYTLSTNSGRQLQADYMNWMAGLSVEAGRMFSNENSNWFVEPQVQAQFMLVTDNDYSNQQTQIKQDDIHSFITRLGFRVGRWFDEEKAFSAYAKADVLHEWRGTQRIYATDQTTSSGGDRLVLDNKGTWFDTGLGFQARVMDHVLAYGDIEYRFGNDFADTFIFNLGGKYTF